MVFSVFCGDIGHYDKKGRDGWKDRLYPLTTDNPWGAIRIVGY